ncbi:MAG: ABC transporter ATP-binding protein [Bacteroidales bacterium]|nr:ABC transporter ATP-binding protein [Bacteroidales bacterium]
MKTILKYVRWLWAHSVGARGAVLLNILLGSLNVGLNLYFIYLCKYLVDIATGVRPGSLGLYTGIVLAVIVLRLAVSAVNVRVENLTTSKMGFIIRKGLYSNLLQAEWLGKERRHSGDTVNRLETDVSTVTGVICSDVPQIFTTLVQLVAAIVFLCTMEWRLALLLVVVTPLFVVFSKVFFRRLREMTRGIRETESEVQSHLQESLQHRMVIQSMENEGRMEGRLDDLQDREYGQIRERTRFNIFARTMVSAAFSFGYIAAFLWGVYGLSRGSITFGMMTAFLQLVGQIQRPVVNLTRQIPSFVYATASIDRLMELEEAPKAETGDPVRLDGPAGIRVKGLSYRYPDGHRMILSGLDFDFPPLSRTAIVGETGAGKSTLIRLMLALLKPVEGSVVLYDAGREVEASPSTRCNLVYVPQGNTLFSGTVRENLLVGNPESTEHQMREALETAVADFVLDLPDGLDTRCGEGGAGLSEGQAQRIAIARGLLRPGSILLLDEFSSSLDPETEERLMENLTKKAAGKTMIFITHRERIAQYCERTCPVRRRG